MRKATNQNVTPTSPCGYAIQITLNNCAVRSACLQVVIVGTDPVRATPHISAFPNPSSGTFILQSDLPGRYILGNAIGQTLRTFELSATKGFAITVAQLSTGMYFLRGLGDDGGVVTKILVQR